ncbi:MAG: hypothetical protein RDU59_08520 [Thermodesulfobacteriota bacterium]|nr:hypothetical protein [Thermodesulfobacteriota bacterium]
MKQKIRPIDTGKIKTYSLKERESKVSREHFGRVLPPGARFSDFLQSLPDILAGSDLRAIVKRVAEAVRNGRPVLIGMGAHVIKVGLNPILIALMEKGVVSGLAVNGACIIHDTEIAMVGRTSEDVAVALGGGDFGMAEETAGFLNEAITRGAEEGLGLGEAVGRRILESGLPYAHLSLLATAARLDIPLTVHVAIGADIIHMHPKADGAAIGKTSLHDFRVFCSLVAMLDGGVYFNIGSAVILPEVFLKALSVARNLGHEVKQFTTVNMDFIRHYRPMTNVVSRPTMDGGQGYCLVGHHEIMVPLLAAAILEELQIS